MPETIATTAEPATVKPSEEAVRTALLAHQDAGSDRCSCGYHAVDRNDHAARAVLALLDSQRTEAQVKAEALREFRESIAYPLRDGWPLPGESDPATISYVLDLLAACADRIDAWTGRYKRARIYGRSSLDWIDLGSLRALVATAEGMSDKATVTVTGLSKAAATDGEYYVTCMYVREEEADR